MNDMKMLTIAAQLAAQGSLKKNYLMAAVAVRKDGVMVASQNALTKTPEPAAHAESRVLRKAGHGSILYIVRVVRKGHWALAKPCVRCMQLIKNKRVKKVIYTVKDNEYHTVIL